MCACIVFVLSDCGFKYINSSVENIVFFFYAPKPLKNYFVTKEKFLLVRL